MHSKQKDKKKHFSLRLSAFSFGAFVVLIALLSACGGTSTTSTPTVSAGSTPQATPTAADSLSSLPHVTVTGTDYAYQMPKSIPTGMVVFTFSNKGKMPHQLQIAQLNPGVTPAQVMAVAAKGSIPGISQLVSFVGGVNATLAVNGAQQAVLNITPGQYAALCFIAGPDGMPHFQMGMIDMFTAANAANSSSTKPSTDTTVTLSNFSFKMPATLHQGSLIQVTNQGDQSHEMTIVKAAPGKTTKDVVDSLITNGPDGATIADTIPVGGMGALAPGKTGWLMLNLPPGDYVATCFVVDAGSRKAHSMLGMEYQFTVQA
jgi:hypothetical protein